MRVCLIKNSMCLNIAEFKTLEEADGIKELLGFDEVIESEKGEIGYKHLGGDEWEKIEPIVTPEPPTTEDRLMAVEEALLMIL